MCQFLLLVEKNRALVDSIGKGKRKYLSFTLENQAHVLSHTKKEAFHFSSPPRLDHALCGPAYPLSALLANGRIGTSRSVLVETDLPGRAFDLCFLLECLGHRSQILTQRKKLPVFAGDPCRSSALLWADFLLRTIYAVWHQNA